MKIFSGFIAKNTQHFNETSKKVLALLLKPNGGIESDSSGLYVNTASTNGIVVTDKYIVNSTIITNTYIDLSQTPKTNEHLNVIYNGIILDDGTGNDYSISGTRITFDATFTLTINDKIIVKYKY